MNHSVIRQGTSTRLASLKGSRHEGLATRVHAMSAGRPTSVASLAMVQTTSDSMESTGGLLIAAGACLEAQACGVVVGACTRRWGGHGGAPAARRLGSGGCCCGRRCRRRCSGRRRGQWLCRWPLVLGRQLRGRRIACGIQVLSPFAGREAAQELLANGGERQAVLAAELLQGS